MAKFSLSAATLNRCHMLFWWRYMKKDAWIRRFEILKIQWIRICMPVQRTQVQSLVQEDPICHGATKPVHHNYWNQSSRAHQLQLLSPWAITLKSACPRVCALQWEKPLQWEAHVPQPKVKVKSLSRVRLFATPWTVAYKAPPSMGFSRQEYYWSGLPFPSPGDLPNPRIEPGSPTLQADALLSELPGKPST